MYFWQLCVRTWTVSSQTSLHIAMLGNFDKYGGVNIPVLWGREDTQSVGIR